MPITRRRLLFAGASVIPAAFGIHAFAQSVLLEQVRVLVGFPSGGGTDSAARRVAEGIRGVYGKTLVVENKPGASGRLVVDEMRRGPADGSIMVVQPEAVITQQPHVDPKNTHYSIDDVAAIGGIGQIQHAFAVGPAVPDSVRSMKDFFAWARANQGKANFGTPGANSAQDFLMRPVLQELNLQLTHAPYRGSAPGVQDLIGGQISAFFSPVGDSLPHQGTGRMRLLGTSGERRAKFAPDVQTFAEQGFPAMTLAEWYGVWMSKGTPDATRAAAASAISSAVMQPACVEALGKFGIEATPIGQQEFAAAVRASYAAWAERLRKIGFQPET